MKTMAAFIEQHGIEMISEQTTDDLLPASFADADWDHTSWLCTFTLDGRTMAVPYFMGLAHESEPDAGEVLDSLASDTTVRFHDGFESWAGDYGYDTDSRRAYATWEAVVEQTGKLAEFLGPDLFDELVEKVERL